MSDKLPIVLVTASMLLASCAAPMAVRPDRAPLRQPAAVLHLSDTALWPAQPILAPEPEAPVAAQTDPANDRVLPGFGFPADRVDLPSTLAKAGPDDDRTLHVGVGTSFSPSALLFAGSMDMPLDEYLTYGPALQIGLDSNAFLMSGFGQLKYWFGKESERDTVLPYVQAGLGLVYMDRSGRSGDLDLLLNVGGGVRLLTGDSYRIGSNFLWNFVPGEVAGEDTFFTWEIVQVSVDI